MTQATLLQYTRSRLSQSGDLHKVAFMGGGMFNIAAKAFPASSKKGVAKAVKGYVTKSFPVRPNVVKSYAEKVINKAPKELTPDMSWTAEFLGELGSAGHAIAAKSIFTKSPAKDVIHAVGNGPRRIGQSVIHAAGNGAPRIGQSTREAMDIALRQARDIGVYKGAKVISEEARANSSWAQEFLRELGAEGSANSAVKAFSNMFSGAKAIARELTAEERDIMNAIRSAGIKAKLNAQGKAGNAMAAVTALVPTVQRAHIAKGDNLNWLLGSALAAGGIYGVTNDWMEAPVPDPDLFDSLRKAYTDTGNYISNLFGFPKKSELYYDLLNVR